MSDFDSPELLHEIIAIGAERHPDSIAFRCNAADLSYAELANDVAARAGQLAALGVKPGDRVGVMLPKCLQSAAAVHGVMACGAAYVPLDPAMPAARLISIVEDCDLRVLITHSACRRTLIKALTAGVDLRDIIAVDDFNFDELDIDNSRSSVQFHRCDSVQQVRPIDLRSERVTQSALAYIMYTSGSTGQPKGLMHTHASGLAYARMSARLYGLRGDDRLASHSPLHFDMSTLDYFSGPLAGACTVILPESHMKMPASLSKLIDDEALSIWYSVPYALIQLLLHGVLEQRDLGSLRWVLYGGEPFAPRHLAALMKRLPQARFGNVYGPAEVNQVSFFELGEPPGSDVRAVSIGRLVSNADGIIVDENNDPVVDGQAGELLVRTPQMMQGYWKRPELNAKTFLKRPDFRYFDSIWCRTGDEVLTDTNGLMHFLGRRDRLVKTRGNRVELDEVEAALSMVEGVVEAAAFLYPGDDDSQEIGAVVTCADSTVDEKLIRKSVARQLPVYAIPRRVSVLASMPRTGSDKIDRLKLSRSFDSNQSVVTE